MSEHQSGVVFIHAPNSVTMMISVAPGITIGVTLNDADLDTLYADRQTKKQPAASRLLKLRD